MQSLEALVWTVAVEPGSRQPRIPEGLEVESLAYNPSPVAEGKCFDHRPQLWLWSWNSHGPAIVGVSLETGREGFGIDP